MSSGHGGNIFALAQKLGCNPTDIVDVSSNINPLGPLPELMDHLQTHLMAITALPDINSGQIVRRMASTLEIEEHSMLAGAGTTQLIHALFPALESRRVLIVGPTYSDYKDACRIHRIKPDYFFATENENFTLDLKRLEEKLPTYDTVVICNPNNPTGTLLTQDQLRELCARHPKTRFVIDESYLAFAADEKGSMIKIWLDNVVVLHSLSKIFRIPGLRIGFIVAPESIISKIAAIIPPWSVNSLAQKAVEFICDHPALVHHFIDKTRFYIETEKKKLFEDLQKNQELQAFPSTTTYFLVKLPQRLTAEKVCNHFAQQRLLIRNCGNFDGLSDRFIRIAVHQKEVNRKIGRMLANLRDHL